jgi:hypothetical protein
MWYVPEINYYVYRKVTFFPGEAMSPDKQCFKDVVRTKDKLLYRQVVTHVLILWGSHDAGHAVLQGCDMYQRYITISKSDLLPWRGHVARHAVLQGCGKYQR